MMPKVRDVCHEVRSKNAGPFWVTFDLFFKGPEEFERYANSPELAAPLFARLYGVDEEKVKHFPIESLHTLKVTCPRPRPQGGIVERDMHAGQQFVRLLDINLGSGASDS